MSLSLRLATACVGLFLAARPLSAACEYFRVSLKLHKCGVVDSAALPSENPYQDADALPEFVDEKPKAFVQAVCRCEYSLKGSDIRCDMDQWIEKKETWPADDPSAVCRRGKTLCREICPKTLP